MKKLARAKLTHYLVLGAIVSAAGGGSSSSTASATGDRTEACITGMNYVKLSLKAPATAKFPSCSQMTIVQDGPAWRVGGYVDSQNGFGALLRSNFTVGMSYTGNKTYQLTSISIQ